MQSNSKSVHFSLSWMKEWVAKLMFSMAFAVAALSWVQPVYAQSGTAAGSTTDAARNTPFVITNDDYFVNKMLKGLLGDGLNLNAENAATTFTAPGTLGEVFRTFNLGVAFFGTLMILFVAVVGILNSGQDGEFLGRKWSSFWVPVRFAGGAALMLPVTTSGYSFVQAMCIWIAGQGIGFADSIWNTILDSHKPPAASQVVSVVSTSEIVSSVLLAQICQDFFNAKDSGSIVFKSGTFDVGINTKEWVGVWTSKKAASNNVWKQEGSQYCGRVSYRYADSAQDSYTPIREEIRREHATQLQAAIDNAKGPAATFLKAVNDSSTDADDLEKAGAVIKTFIETQSKAYSDGLSTSVDKGMEKAKLTGKASFHEQLKKYGFAVAGAYYMELSKSSNSVREGLSAAPTVSPPSVSNLQALADPESWATATNQLKNFISSSTIDASTALSRSMSSPTTDSNSRAKTIDLNKEMFTSLDSGFLNRWSHSMSMFILATVVQVGTNNNAQANSSWMPNAQNEGDSNVFTVFTNDRANHSVIAQLKDKGDTILNIAGLVYTSYLIGKATIDAADESIIGKIANVVGGSRWIASAINTFGSMVFALVLSMVTLGILLAIIIPMTPFMIWTMGLAGLMVLIIEALVASMLWAVMIMHPSGEGLTSDQSRQGLMILMMLFFRPALMLMGMAAGLFMVDPMVDYVNDMFYFVFKGFQRDSISFIFTTIGICSVYITLVLAIVRKSFALIHLVPDRVLRWVGGVHESLGESEVADRGENLAGGAGQRISNLTAGLQNNQNRRQQGSGNSKVPGGTPNKSGSSNAVAKAAAAIHSPAKG